MKILQINSFFTVGGPPRIVNGIYDTLLENGYECKIAAGREKQYVPQHSIQIGNKYSPYINALQCRLFDNDGFAAKSATKKLVEQIKAYNPDIIHLHNLHGYYINVEILFKYLKECGKPIIWTLHDCWGFTGHCPHFSAVGCQQWKTACKRCTLAKEYPNSYLLNRAKSNFIRKKAAFTGVPNMTIITPSKWLASVAKEGFLGEYPIIPIPNGIDLEKFYPIESDFKSKYGLENKKIVLGVAQVWGERKGLKDFIALSEKLGEEYQVVLVGLTQKQMQTLPSNILAFERTNSVEELAKLYTCADVFVNPSVQETMGLTTAEALACGTPAVVYDETAVPEVVDERSGIVVRAGDIDGLIKAIKSIRLNAEDCIRRAKEYEKSKKYNEYIEIYKNSL